MRAATSTRISPIFLCQLAVSLDTAHHSSPCRGSAFSQRLLTSSRCSWAGTSGHASQASPRLGPPRSPSSAAPGLAGKGAEQSFRCVRPDGPSAGGQAPPHGPSPELVSVHTGEVKPSPRLCRARVPRACLLCTRRCPEPTRHSSHLLQGPRASLATPTPTSTTLTRFSAGGGGDERLLPRRPCTLPPG